MTLRDSRAVEAIIAIAGATFVAFFAVARIDHIGPLARPEFGVLLSLPLPAYPVALMGLGSLFIVRRTWWFGLAMFFCWLPFEDLVRKFANNDLRVYFVKDLLLAVALVGMGPRLAECWRRPLGDVWLPTIGIFGLALVYAIPSALTSPAIPIIGIHGRFLYASLLPVGVYVAQDRERLRVCLRWMAVLAAVVCSVGIAQSIIGPKFLNPSVDPSTLEHLVVTKTLGEADVVRPSGPFADVSRYASMTIVATTLAACSLRLAATRHERRVALVTLAVALAGTFASGSRTALLLAPPVAVLAALSIPKGTRRRLLRALLAILAVFVLSATAVGGAALSQSLNRVALYVGTLDPSRSTFELPSRFRAYAANATAGVEFGGVLGHGTGTEAIGKRYLGLEETASQVESGWGAVASEWGILGLFAWLAWSLLWVRRAVRASREKGSAASEVAPVITGYVASLLLLMFSLGSGFLDNYIANIFLWFLSGVAFAALSNSERSAPAHVRPAERA